jgi:uncharacterized protein YutE (UPF0331/DUF86 family)
MTDISPEFINYKLRMMLQHLRELEPFAEISLEQFLSDRYKQLIVERLLELIIQISLDLTRHLLKELNRETAKTNADTFIEASEIGIISSELAQDLGNGGKLRNLIVHRYDQVDYEKIFAAIKVALEKYPIYVEQVSGFLDSLEVNDV